MAAPGGVSILQETDMSEYHVCVCVCECVHVSERDRQCTWE